MSNDTLQDIRDAIAGDVQDALDALSAGSAALAQRAMGDIPATATPFCSANTTAIDGTTPREIRAAVTSKKKWITKAVFVNGTAGENPVLVIQDDTGTPVRHAVCAPGGSVTTTSGAATLSPTREVSFNPPIPIAAGKAVNGRSIASCTGCFIAIQGFEEA